MGLLKAMDEFGIDRGLIITKYFKDNEKIGSKEVLYIPLYELLLSS
ncbi:MAG: hypothetical protein ACTSWY_06500 [Promethearchaeota archaeon]